MKKILKNWQSFLFSIAIVIGLSVTIPAVTLAFDQNQQGTSPQIVSPHETIYGMTYGDWSAAWWQWALAFKNADNPILDISGDKCGNGQGDGPVFFLAGTATNPTLRTLCTVPAGKALFFPIINAECSTVEPYPFLGGNERDLRVCASKILDGADLRSLKVSIDGVGLQGQGLKAFRAQSPVYGFTCTADDNFLTPFPNHTTNPASSGLSLSDGYWVMVEPLPPGKHTIHFEGVFASGTATGWLQNVTYQFTVVK